MNTEKNNQSLNELESKQNKKPSNLMIFITWFIILFPIVIYFLFNNEGNTPSLEEQIGHQSVDMSKNQEELSDKIQPQTFKERIDYVLETDQTLDKVSRDYLTVLSNYFSEYEKFQESFSELNKKLYSNFNLSTSSEWNDELNVLFAQMKEINGKMYDENPSSYMKVFHEFIQSGLKELNFFMNTYPTAITELDEEQLDKSIQSFKNSQFIFDRTIIELEERER